MEDSLVHNFQIKSHKGIYQVDFDNNILENNRIAGLGTHYIVDKNVLDFVSKQIPNDNLVIIEANETTKSYRGVEPIITELITKDLKRDSVLVAIGGGITQDITCFIANTFMRGIKWKFIPTTLLAQADSCIGSKSSINFGDTKNILGSFTPPDLVIICQKFLSTLEEKDIESGIGEIIKLYIVDQKIVDSNEIKENLLLHLYNTLQIKKHYIEMDEFDQGPRNILNYGHCFGHAIESATNFGIPHGIAVTMGMDIANKLALTTDNINQLTYHSLHQVLLPNYEKYKNVKIDMFRLFAALAKDKKNTGSKINIILPVKETLKKVSFENNEEFKNLAETVMKSLISLH